MLVCMFASVTQIAHVVVVDMAVDDSGVRPEADEHEQPGRREIASSRR